MKYDLYQGCLKKSVDTSFFILNNDAILRKVLKYFNIYYTCIIKPEQCTFLHRNYLYIVYTGRMVQLTLNFNGVFIPCSPLFPRVWCVIEGTIAHSLKNLLYHL